MKVSLQCSPWWRPAGAVEQKPVRLARVLAEEGRGKGLGATGTRFGRSAGAVVAPASRHAGGQGGGRRGCRSPARSGLGERETGRLDCVDAREGGGGSYSACSWPATGARRGRAQGCRWAARSAVGGGLRVGVKGSGAFIGAGRSS
jgi:hypothetical protein